MDIEKLRPEDFDYKTYGGYPLIRFTIKGAIILSHKAVEHLKLKHGKDYFGVSIFKDKNDPCNFSIRRDSEGWQLRPYTNGQVIFNNAGLARHVLARTFEKCAHPAGTAMPASFTFRIALRSIDDDKNFDVFALLRNKS